MSPLKDIFGSRLIFAGPHKSFTKADNCIKSEMSNAFILTRERILEELQAETEERCYAIRTNEKIGCSVNPYPYKQRRYTGVWWRNNGRFGGITG